MTLARPDLEPTPAGRHAAGPGLETPGLPRWGAIRAARAGVLAGQALGEDLQVGEGPLLGDTGELYGTAGSDQANLLNNR